MCSCSIFLLFLLLTGRGFSQCFTDSECTGSTVAAASNRDCCFETADGLAFLSNGTCTACPTPIKVGFTQRSQTVSEADIPSIHDVLVPSIPVTSDRVAVRDLHLVFRLLQSSSTATVDQIYTSELDVDALFSVRLAPDEGPLEAEHLLRRGENEISPVLLVVIRNDFVIEDEECFTIRLLTEDVQDRRQFTCNDENSATNYFCEHTICILDDDVIPTTVSPTSEATSPPVPGNIENVSRPSCGVLEWDPPSTGSEGLTYQIRFYSGQSFRSSPSSQRRVLASSTNSLSFTAQGVPSSRPLFAIVKARNSNGVHSHSWSTPIVAAVTGCL